MVLNTPVMTVEEFEAYADSPENRERRLELIHGVIVEKSMPTEVHGNIALRVGGRLLDFVEDNDLGTAFVEGRYKSNNTNARLPDVSVRFGNEPLTAKGSAPSAPDIVVEVQSPDDTIAEMRKKAAHYLEVGVKMVILVITLKKLVVVLTPTVEEILTLEDMLTGLDVLPGFEMSVKEIFKKVANNKQHTQDEE